MTGYGEASDEVGKIQYAVEVRSLNNRFFKALIRLPDTITSLDAELETRLRKRIVRGSLTLTVRIHAREEANAYRVNEAALQSYIERIKDFRRRLPGGGDGTHLDLALLMTLPGVLESPHAGSDLVESARPVLLRLTDLACDNLLAMRAAEGQAVRDDLTEHCSLIRQRLERIQQRAPDVIEDYHRRLRQRIDELASRAAVAVETPDLIREVALFAERADIAEEVQRMQAHLAQFDEIVAGQTDEPVGRKLDFLAQELLREANTVASKSNDGRISRDIIEVKGAIDRIKEQVQNVE